MPKKLKPNQQLEFVLEGDKQDPVETRVVFYAKSLVASQSIELAQKLEDTPLKVSDLYLTWVEILSSLLTGWKNMPVEYNGEESIKNELDPEEIIELIRKIQQGQTTTYEEKKS